MSNTPAPPVKRAWAVAVTAPHTDPKCQGDAGCQDDAAPSSGQSESDLAVPLMACVVTAPDRTAAERVASDHFRRSFLLEHSAAVATSSVEIELTIPELLTFVPGLSILEASEEAHWIQDASGLELAGFGNPGPPVPAPVQKKRTGRSSHSPAHST